MKLVKYNDPILREVIEPFDFDNPSVEPNQFAIDLVKAMHEYGGVGLAANQVGHRVRAFAMNAQPNIVCFNPIVVDYSEESVELEEGCLTYPGLIVFVNRPRHIKVRFTLPNGETRTERYTGITARIFQHELEHLEGKRFFDQVNWYDKERVKRWMKKRK